MGRYSDPTANMAISNIMKEIRKKEREEKNKKAGENNMPQASKPAACFVIRLF